jgi:hypothetical protein
MNFYDREGAAIAYLHENDETIYSWGGEAIAYLNGTNVYAFSGQHLGWLQKGWILDHHGGNSYFTEDATGGPLKPLKQLKSLKGLRELRPTKGLRSLAPLKPLRSTQWGDEIFG